MIPYDKSLHFIGGIVIGVLVLIALAIFGVFTPAYAVCGPVLTALVIGSLKEGKDAYVNFKATGNPFKGSHGVEFNDALATFLGGFTITMVVIVASYISHAYHAVL